VAPFAVVLPQDAGYYVVAPESAARSPKIARLRDWLIASTKPTPPVQGFPEAPPRAIRKTRRRGGTTDADG
jgi:hypothetical protein